MGKFQPTPCRDFPDDTNQISLSVALETIVYYGVSLFEPDNKTEGQDTNEYIRGTAQTR